MKTRLAATTLAIALLLTGCSSSAGDGEAESPSATAAATTDAAPVIDQVEAPDVVGQPLDEAKAALNDAGITDVTSEDIRDGKSVWMDANWTVVEQRNEGTGVWLGVEKPAEPTPIVEATTPAPVATEELSADDMRFIQVLALEMTLQDSDQKQMLCDAYLVLGADMTATQINAEVEPDSQFPVDVVAEVFDTNC